MFVWTLGVMRLFGGELMTNVEDLALRLAEAWVDNYTLSGAKALQENLATKKMIISEAGQLGITEQVYARANDLMGGE